jgi:uncharacterized protein
MLLAFRVQNFRSIRDEQELSLMRSRRITTHRSDSDSDSDSSEDNVSPVSGIYGSNASGKSNLLLALAEMGRAVKESHSRWAPDDEIPYDPFRLNAEMQNVPTRFEAEISLSGIRYQYGFELNAKIIVSEWLYAYPHGRRQIWFERDTSRKDIWYFGKGLGGHNKVTADVTRPNSLFLSTAATLRHPKLLLIWHWFDHHLRVADNKNLTARLNYTIKTVEESEELSAQITNLLKFADLGICGIDVQQQEPSPQEVERLSRIASTMAAKPDETRTSDEIAKILIRSTPKVELKHICDGVSAPVALPLTSESLGTRALLAMAGPVLRSLQDGFTLLVDEIDTSLHPRLVAELVRLFQDKETNPKTAQIIFTSHDTSLLGNLISEDPVLERDQVWFAEKDSGGVTSVYALTDFSPRRLENLERGYLQGRYGAVPFLDHKELAPAIMRPGSAP